MHNPDFSKPCVGPSLAIWAGYLYAPQMRVSGEDNQDAFKPKKSLGQNFLTSDIVPGWLCEAGEVKPGELVYEIGPGTGRLTAELLKRGARVIALEADERVLAGLRENFSLALKSGQLALEHGDARHITPTSLGLLDKQFKVIANIPYYLSGFLLRQLLESPIQPTTLVFLMQKELVARIARAKKESILSLSIKSFGQPKYFKTVTRGHFHPSPQVDSAILQITSISRDNFKDFSTQHFFNLLHLGLGKKRKQLATNLGTNYPKEVVNQAISKINKPLTVRGEDLSCLDWLSLAQALPEIE